MMIIRETKHTYIGDDMQFVCKRCGKILESKQVIIDPDGDVACGPCYETIKTQWFDEPKTKEKLPWFAKRKKETI